MVNQYTLPVCTRQELAATRYLTREICFRKKDETGLYLRCSMHGFIFDPKTGECQSPVCLGQRLQSLRVEEIDGVIFFSEKHLTLID